MKELNNKIIAWAKDRELDKKGTIEGQAIKTAEEIAELIKGISKNNIDLIKDSIGDVYVTLVVGNMLDEDHDLELILEYAKKHLNILEDLNQEKTLIIQCLGVCIRDVLAHLYKEGIIEEILGSLIAIAEDYELDFKDCVESAYKEIANRKGKTINGTFVKEEDL